MTASCLLLFVSLVHSGPSLPKAYIEMAPSGVFAQRLAAKEVRRYVYLRTGELLPIVAKAPIGRAVIRLELDAKLPKESYGLVSTGFGSSRRLKVSGGSPVSLLYGAYRFAEHLGVRFDLHEDVVPSRRIHFLIPKLNETRKPLFALRGIQPFHDFPEGPDWWSPDDYLSYVSRLPRLGMNFIGFHCYPEGGVGPEPLVWIGRESDLNADGTIKAAYPSRWVTTAGSPWGADPIQPSEFTGGSSGLFPRGFAPDAMEGNPYSQATDAGQIAVFERAAANTLSPAFRLAHRLGVKTCVGTETPITLPKLVRDRLAAEGRQLDALTMREVYRAMFRRIMAAYPLDYYWLWTPEDWTWGGNKPEQYAGTLADMRAALAALKDLGNPFQLATSGWVLGPSNDRAALDKDLPKDVPLSAINRQVGHEPVDPAFGKIKGRPTWAIPWLENDPDLVGYQPWVGRMRADAARAKAYECAGLLGIHWRTASIGMNLAALAQAGWDQTWAKAGKSKGPATPMSTVLGGTTVQFTVPVDDTDEDPVYQTVRYNVDGYRLAVPNGAYRVTLKFNEPHYSEAGKRVFGVDIQGRPLVRGLDMFARAGKNRAFDLAADGVKVTGGVLRIDFIKEVEYPCIAGIEVISEGTGIDRRFILNINCGGPKWQDFQADLRDVGSGKDRAAPVAGFYLDWALARFGPEAGKQAGAIFASLDGTAFPQLSDWLDGPGGLPSIALPWAEERKGFAFIGKLEALHGRIRGAAERERFDVWLERMRYFRSLRELSCARGELDREVAALRKAAPGERPSSALRCVGIRERMARLWEAMLTHLMASIETPGELGTIANLEMHTRLHNRFLNIHDAEIESALGSKLPATVAPRTDGGYAGPDRLVMVTQRDLGNGSPMSFRVALLTGDGKGQVRVFWRPMGSYEAPRPALVFEEGGFYRRFDLPVLNTDVEYWVEARTAFGRTLRLPPAPGSVFTVLATGI